MPTEIDTLEKNFFLGSDGEDEVEVEGQACVLVYDAECRLVAAVPRRYAQVVLAALNAYGDRDEIQFPSACLTPSQPADAQWSAGEVEALAKQSAEPYEPNMIPSPPKPSAL